MVMLRYATVAFALLASFLVFAGLTEEESKAIHEFMVTSADTCEKEFDITVEDFQKAKKSHNLDSIDPCFIACLMKAQGLIDDKGMFVPKQGYAIAEKFVKSPDELASVKKNTEICESVNEKAVSDGDKGCDRANMVLQCLIDNRSHVM